MTEIANEDEMYNRIYDHLTTNNLLYEKQFGFQKQCSTEYAISQLSIEILKSFKQNKYTLGVFIDLISVKHLTLSIMIYFSLN